VKVLEKAESLLKEKGTPRALAMAGMARMLMEKRRADASRG
jgi:hypothetical protein